MRGPAILENGLAAYLPPDRDVGMMLHLVDIFASGDDTVILYANDSITEVDSWPYYYQLQSSIDTDDRMCTEMGIDRRERRRRYLKSRSDKKR